MVPVTVPEFPVVQTFPETNAFDDPTNHSIHPYDPYHHDRMLLCRCYSNLRQCFVLVMLPNPDAIVSLNNREREIFFIKNDCLVHLKKSKTKILSQKWIRKKTVSTDGTISVGPPSNAWPNKESRMSPLRSRSRSLVESLDRSRDRDRWSRLVSRLRSELRFRWRWCAGIGWMSVSLFNSNSDGLMPCCARYRSTLLIRFWGGGVRWFDRSSGKSHGKDVDVCDEWQGVNKNLFVFITMC